MSEQSFVEFDSPRFLEITRKVIDDFQDHPKLGMVLQEKGKRGGYVSAGEVGYGLYFTSLIGFHPVEKPTSFDMAGAKVRYLLDNPNARMSREGRNPPLLWGGGLRLPGTTFVIGFTGYPEHMDELVVMTIGARLGLLTRDDVTELLTQFPNDFARPSESNVIFF